MDLPSGGDQLMGYQLRRWLADRLPTTLSSGERLVALEIADQANERTRLAYGNNLLEVITHRTGLANQKQVGKVLGKLATNGVELRVPVRNKAGDVIRNKAGRPLYAFEGRKLTFRVPEESEFPAREVPQAGEHSTERSPAGGSTEAERSPAGGQEVPRAGDLVSSSLLKTHPLKASPIPAPRDLVAAGKQSQHDPDAAAAFLESLPAPWTIGPRTAAAMAPDLLAMTSRQGWGFDEELVAKLTEKPEGIKNYSAILRIRIGDLPKQIKPAPRPSVAPLSEWCGDCADGSRAAIREGRLRLIYDDNGHARPCPKCHPSQTSHAA